MATASQIRANRENAKRSTGPTSDAGKQTSSQNGLKHGLSTDHLLVQGESEEEFNAFLSALLEHHQPANITETMLVQDMAKHHWLADRALRIQNYAIMRALPDAPANLGLLIRYHTANERAYHRALTALNASRKTRLAEIGFASKQPAHPSPSPQPAPRPTPPTPQKTADMIAKGFTYNSETGEFVKCKTA